CQFINNGGENANFGGAVRVNSHVNFTGCNFTANNALNISTFGDLNGFGGALYINFSDIVIKDYGEKCVGLESTVCGIFNENEVKIFRQGAVDIQL
ncbi:hypothetical protein IJF81_03595, partial [bacterium]|nr:hypothetical protein [bacterium]